MSAVCNFRRNLEVLLDNKLEREYIKRVVINEQILRAPFILLWLFYLYNFSLFWRKYAFASCMFIYRLFSDSFHLIYSVLRRPLE